MSQYLRVNIKKEHFKYYYWGDIKFKSHIGVCVYQTLKKRGYNKTQNDDWNIFWSQKQLIDHVFEHYRIFPHQRINHFRTFYQLCRKDNLSRNLKKYKKLLEKQGKIAEAQQYNFFPLTYHLPLEYGIFLDQFKKNVGSQNKNIWIMKPVAKSQGKGIFLFNKLSSIANWAQNPQAEHYIAQKYISDPLLIGGKKFDLRLYVLCLSYHPLTVYLNRSGFARFTHYRYDQNKIYNSQIHLTNVAIQKWQMVCRQIEIIFDVKIRFQNKKVNQSFYNIQTLVIKTLKSVTKLMLNDKRCFQLYGFDILLDANLKPWIIQVNGSPSMRANTPSDNVLKCGIIDDVLTIIDLEKILTGDQQQVGGFDLIYKNDIPKASILGPNFSFLGCKNNRIQNMQKIAKNSALRLAKEYNEEEKRKTDRGLESHQSQIMNNNKTFSIGRTTRKVVSNKPTIKIQKEIKNETIKNNQSEVMSNTSGINQKKGWIIRKNSSFKKQVPSPKKPKTYKKQENQKQHQKQSQDRQQLTSREIQEDI